MTDAECEAPLYTTEAEAIAHAEQHAVLRSRSKQLEEAADQVKYDEAMTFARARADLQGSTFLNSCEQWLAEHGFLSKKQIAALMPLKADQERERKQMAEMLEVVVRNHPKDRFVQSLNTFFSERGYLSKKQFTCLEEMFEKDLKKGEAHVG